MPGSGKRGPGRPPVASVNDTRLRIMQAARSVFSERGYDGATIRAIAVRAGLTRPPINHYFPSKQALYRAVLNATNESVLGAGINHAQRETTLAARLNAFISAAVSANLACPDGSAVVNGILSSWVLRRMMAIGRGDFLVVDLVSDQVVPHAHSRRSAEKPTTT